MDLHIKEIHCFENELQEQVFRIYTASFPPSEQIEFSEIVDTVACGDRLLYIAEENNNVVGFALINPLSPEGVFLLEYIAVAANFRNRGIGTQLLKHVKQVLHSNENARGILFEVEPIGDGKVEEMHLRERRISFYLRNGAHIIDQAAAYRMPDLSGKGALDMHLMWIPLDKSYRTIPTSSLKEYITSIYTEAYDRTESDPLLISILKNI